MAEDSLQSVEGSVKTEEGVEACSKGCLLLNNLKIAQVFYEIADLLEIEGVKFIPAAYRRAARAIETIPTPLRAIHERGALETIPGVGSKIGAKVIELLETGRLAYLEELRTKLPPGLTELLNVEGIGPKTIRTLHTKLKISGIDQLETEAKQGQLRGLKGFGEKTEENILQGIAMYRRAKPACYGLIVGYVFAVGCSFLVDLIWFPTGGHYIHGY